MAVTDKISGFIRAQIRLSLNRTEDNMDGEDVLDQDYRVQITDGTSTNQANGWCSELVSVTTAAVTFSLASSTDPFSTIGDSVPTSDPSELKLRAIMIHNTDATNYVTIKKGTNGLTSWFSGATDTLAIPPGGVLLATFPAGLDAMTDGADDEIVIQANTAACICNISYVYG